MAQSWRHWLVILSYLATNLYLATCKQTGYNVISNISPFFITEKYENCTVKASLPCSISVIEFYCPLEEDVPVRGWPGSPDKFTVSVDYALYQGRCLGAVNYHWIIPNDNSALSVTGFELNVIATSGDFVNQQFCVTFDLSQANWTTDDIWSQIGYSYNGTFLKHGSYIAILSSLPKQMPDQVDNKYLQISFEVARSYQVDGQCVLPVSTTERPRVRSTSTASPPQRHPRPTPTPTSNVPLAVGAGVGGGVLLIVLLVVMTVRPWRGRPTGQRPPYQPLPDPEYPAGDDDEVPSASRAVSEAGDDLTTMPVECNCHVPDRVWRVPVAPSVISTDDLSEAAASVNRSEL